MGGEACFSLKTYLEILGGEPEGIAHVSTTASPTGVSTPRSDLSVALDEVSSDRAEAWLRDEVCPVVEELIPNRGFRLAARWSVDHLGPGGETDERRLVEAVDTALV
jgi:hypothetical protein